MGSYYRGNDMMNCSLTNDQRRLGQRCDMAKCEACRIANAKVKKAKAKAVKLLNIETLIKSIESAGILAEMLKSDHTTVHLENAISNLEDAKTWLRVHRNEVELSGLIAEREEDELVR